MGKTLYVSDLDGTLLGSDKKLSENTVKTIGGLIESGMLFTYATARSYATAHVVAQGITPRLPLILNNGVFLYDPHTASPIEACTMTHDRLKPLFGIIESERIPAMVYSMISGEERVSYLPDTRNFGMESYVEDRKGDERLREVSSYEELFAGEIFFFTIIENPANAERIHKACSGNPYYSCTITNDIYRPDEWWVEIYRADATKASAIEKLKKRVGVDRVVCFGDGTNDIPMFRSCDECYATANAHPDVLKIATAVIGSCEEDGVAKWLSAHALLP